MTEQAEQNFEDLLDSARELADTAEALSRQADEQRRRAVRAAVEAGMSQSEIARRLGITQPSVNRIINGKQ